jgi:NADH-quinone oxidoreductase subunit N
VSFGFLQDFGPIAILVLGAAVCCGLDLMVEAPADGRGPLSRWIALATLVIAFAASVAFWHSSFGPTPPDVEHGSFLLDRFALFFYPATLGATGILLLCGADSESDLDPHLGVYHALLLVSAAGVLFTASAADLVSLAVGLALTALPLSLALGLRKTDAASMRLAIRSFSITGLLLAVFVAGEAIVAGLAGSTELYVIAHRLVHSDPLLALAAILIVIGAAGQVGVFPFGAWRAEEMTRAPLAPAAARTILIALAAVAALLRLLPGALSGAEGSWTVTVAMLAGLTLIVAPLLALRQRRLSAAVAHLLVAQLVLALVALPEVSDSATTSILYFLLCFFPLAAAALSLFGAIVGQGVSDSRRSLRGLWARSPLLAALLAALLVALAGAPPLAGFFARLFTVESALKGGFWWLVWLALASALLSGLVAFRWLLILFNDQVDGPEIALPGTASLFGLAVCGAAIFGFTIMLGPLMAIAARGALPPLFGP